MKDTVQSLGERLTQGTLSSVALTKQALARALDAAGEGGRVFIKVYAESACRTAAEIDALRASGKPLSPIAGLPISIKDLFNVEGEVTKAGSTALANREPAKRDAEVIRRLKCAGAVLVGRTNMSEFAFTGVGMNPHYGTPANPHERTRRLIPGGSSSGAPVSVTDGMAVAAIGTDTGGSVRIPAALCGVVGFKPTQNRIPLQGVFPLSGSLDSVGVIARTVACCAEVDAILSGEPWVRTNVDLKSRTVAVPKNHFLEDLDSQVTAAFERSIGRLSAAGAAIVEVTLPGISEIDEINGRGGLSGPEAYAWHRRLGTGFEGYDPFVRERILRGRDISAADYLDMLAVRRTIIASCNEWQAKSRWDVIACPTVPIVAPEISHLENDPKLYRHVNRLLLRNPSVVNFLNRCALSLPCHAKGEAPVGLMLIGRGQEDHVLLNLGIAIERALSPNN